MADSTGKREAGMLTGNTMFEGRYFQCLRSDDDEVAAAAMQFEPQYCVTAWGVYSPIHVSFSVVYFLIAFVCSFLKSLLL